MAGLVPAIHVFLIKIGQDVDARHKAGHDEPHIASWKMTPAVKRRPERSRLTPWRMVTR
jgi:hypothetical protein